MLKFFEKFLDFIFQKRCYLCGKSDENVPLCSKCFDTLEKNKFQSYNNSLSDISFYAAGVYEGNLKRLIRGLKFHNQRVLAKYLAQFMFDYWQNLHLSLKNVKIIAVAQYIKTKKPYNHAQEIAQEFAKLTGFDTDFELVKRIKKTKPQYKLTRQQRLENLDGAFCLSHEIDKDTTYIIIDDIITTSSTVEQIQKTLQTNNTIVFCTSMSGAYLK